MFRMIFFKPNRTSLNVVSAEPGEGLIEAAALDRDDFDQHECMGVVLQSVEHFHVKFGAKYQSGEIPLWMKSLYATLENTGQLLHPILLKLLTQIRFVTLVVD
jgi:hypothetical protein